VPDPTRFLLTALLLSTLLIDVAQAQPADRIWTGDILTMNDDLPRADYVAARDGVIVAVGTGRAPADLLGEATEQIELGDRAMVPGFVDAHGHVYMIGVQALSANMLPAPDGEVNSIADLQRVLGEWAEAYPERIERAGFILGFGYDNAQLAELRHPTREDLDAVSTDVPVLVIHQSGHIGAVNSKGMEVMGYDADSEEVIGGVIRRGEGNVPNGVLEEAAFFSGLINFVRTLDPASSRSIFLAGTELIASYGYTTAQEGRSSPGQTQLMRDIAANEGIEIDVVVYPDVLVDRDFILDNHSREYLDRLRVGGAKLTIDGSPQGFTALRDRPYYRPPAHLRAGYKGYASITEEQVFDAIDWAYANDVQILTHSNGEGASDQLIAALETATERHGQGDRRPVLIHGQFLRQDQVASYQELGVFPSLFPMHTFYWGDWHRERTVGPVNAENISPTGWLLERGMRFSSHHDAPVAFPDSMRILDATVTRRSRSGDIIGPQHRVDVMTALKAMTIWPAYQHFEENSKGSIEVGKRADLVMLSADPTAIDPETLDGLRVMETVKDGRTIYVGDASEVARQLRPTRSGLDPFGNLVLAMSRGDALMPNGGHGPTCGLHPLRIALAEAAGR
jgi:predicted amidohydrolase YtcJ